MIGLRKPCFFSRRSLGGLRDEQNEYFVGGYKYSIGH